MREATVEWNTDLRHYCFSSHLQENALQSETEIQKIIWIFFEMHRRKLIKYIWYVCALLAVSMHLIIPVYGKQLSAQIKDSESSVEWTDDAY